MLTNLHTLSYYFLQPFRLFKTYERKNLQFDLIAAITVAIILLPQAIAFAIIAELPPQMGIYTAIVGAFVGGLWGASHQIHNGPTIAMSLLVLSVLSTVAEPGTSEFIVAAGVVAIIAGIFQLTMGLARLGALVNFVSYSVVVGFTTGAGILIVIKQLPPLLGLTFAHRSITQTLQGIVTHLPQLHWPTFLLGLGTLIMVVLLRKYKPKWPGALIGMAAASLIVFGLKLDQAGVAVIGQLPRGLPPLADLPLSDLSYLGKLVPGALITGAIGLVSTSAIARSIATQTGQRLDSNQEFVGQGLANIATGFFSGFAGGGSFARSAVNLNAGAKTQLSAIFSSLFVLIAMFALAPLVAYLPGAALAGVLLVTAYHMIDRAEIARIWRGARSDAIILTVTLLGALLLNLEVAILLGILFSFAFYILRTGYPRVFPVVPARDFRHFMIQQAHQPSCPQLGILEISGNLYFGAAPQIEEAVQLYLADHPDQRFLLLRIEQVNHCDLRGIQVLDDIRQRCRQRGGDIFLVKTQKEVLEFMKSSGFYDRLGAGHFLIEEEAISHIFYHVLDPAINIYECGVRVFAECQNLPKRSYPPHIPDYTPELARAADTISAAMLWQALHSAIPPTVLDIREPREFQRGHIAQARSLPLSQLFSPELGLDRQNIVLVCRSGRRSVRAAAYLSPHHQGRIQVLQGGMLAWENAGLRELA